MLRQWLPQWLMPPKTLLLLPQALRPLLPPVLPLLPREPLLPPPALLTLPKALQPLLLTLPKMPLAMLPKRLLTLLLPR